jgi:hypothetical protein
MMMMKGILQSVWAIYRRMSSERQSITPECGSVYADPYVTEVTKEPGLRRVLSCATRMCPAGIGRYDEISMQDQLASASRMSAANYTGFFYDAYRSVIFKRVSEGKTPVYQSHTRSEAVWTWLTYYDQAPTRLFVARFSMDLLCHHVCLCAPTNVWRDFYEIRYKIIPLRVTGHSYTTWRSCSCAIGASLYNCCGGV